MEIRASSKLDLRTYKALYRASGSVKNTVIISVYALLLAYFAYYMIRYDILMYKTATVNTVWFFVSLAFITAMIVIMLTAPNRSYKQLGKRRDSVTEFVFYDDVFENACNGEGYEGSVRIGYDQIEKVIETPEFFFIFGTKHSASPVDKSTIEGGTAEQLAERLRDAVGEKYSVRKR